MVMLIWESFINWSCFFYDEIESVQFNPEIAGKSYTVNTIPICSTRVSRNTKTRSSDRKFGKMRRWSSGVCRGEKT